MALKFELERNLMSPCVNTKILVVTAAYQNMF